MYAVLRANQPVSFVPFNPVEMRWVELLLGPIRYTQFYVFSS